MFFSPFITGLLPILAATSTQIETPQHPSIFILSDHASSTSALGNALQTLGYTYISSETLNSSLPQRSTHTFTELSTNATSAELLLQYPNTKFIVPVSSASKEDRGSGVERRPCANSWLTHLAAWGKLLDKPASEIDAKEEIEIAQHEKLDSVRSSLEREGRLLEIILDERERHRGEKWLRLCKFLDLGYSVVERLNLKEFPSSMGQERKVSGMWRLVVQGSGV